MYNLLFLGEVYPEKVNPTQAGNLNIFYTVSSFLKDKKYNCSFLKIELGEENKFIKINKEKNGIFILGKIILKKKKSLHSLYSYPGKIYYKDFKEIFNLEKYNFLISVWSEFCNGLISNSNNSKFAVVGDIYKHQHPRWCKNFFLDFSNFINFKKIFIFFTGILKIPFLKFATIKLIKNFNGFVLINFYNYNYFKLYKNKNIFYIPNMWTYKKNIKKINLKKEAKIILSLGLIRRTGNLLAINYFFKKIYSQLLKEMLIRNNYEFHIFGDKNIPKNILLFLDDKIKVRGYVRDINREFDTAFLMLNLNSIDKNFPISNTRILHAWSHGLPVICHKNQALAMPELIHRKNILLAEDESDFISMINLLTNDSNLRLRIINNSLKTLNKYYNIKKNSSIIKESFDKTFFQQIGKI